MTKIISCQKRKCIKPFYLDSYISVIVSTSVYLNFLFLKGNNRLTVKYTAKSSNNFVTCVSALQWKSRINFSSTCLQHCRGCSKIIVHRSQMFIFRLISMSRKVSHIFTFAYFKWQKGWYCHSEILALCHGRSRKHIQLEGLTCKI